MFLKKKIPKLFAITILAVLFNWSNSSIFGISILHIQGEGVSRNLPAPIWTGGINKDQIFEGVGYGKSGSGMQNNELVRSGKFRGYQNTIDVILDDSEWNLG